MIIPVFDSVSLESIRTFVYDWALVGAAVLGLLVAWDKASTTVKRWLGAINLYHRVRLVEEDVAKVKGKITKDVTG